MPRTENIVLNRQPRVPPTTGQPRLAVIGEAPGMQEMNWWSCPRGHGYSRLRWDAGVRVEVSQCPECGRRGGDADPTPFVGPSGNLLNQVLVSLKLPRDRVFVGNICQWSNLDNFWLRQGKEALASDLLTFVPNACFLLGNLPLRHFHPATGDHFDHVATSEDADVTITDWRGSIFESPFLQWQEKDDDAPALKCVAAYHPAAVLRQPDWLPLFRFDAARVVTEAATTTLDLPVRRYLWPVPGGLEWKTTR
jgi:uracil-DNA glycosylase family 4